VGFKITESVLQKPYAITRVMFEVCEDAVLDGVRYLKRVRRAHSALCGEKRLIIIIYYYYYYYFRYLEVRFSPVLHTAEGLSLSAVMDAICEGLEMAEYHLPITVRVSYEGEVWCVC
jgi:adenosine deaminase